MGSRPNSRRVRDVRQNADYGEFTVSVRPDGVGPAQVMVRNADVQVFVVVRYSM
jgi:hypothetical protein